MKLPHHSSAIVALVTFAITLHAAVGVPLKEGQSRRPSRYPIHSVKSRAIKSDHPLWDDVVVMRWIAKENLVETKSAVYDTNVKSPPSIHLSEGGKKGKAKRHKRSNEPGDGINNDQPPTSQDAINQNEAHVERTADEVEQGETKKSKTSYVAVTPEEVELVYSPEDVAKYYRLQTETYRWTVLLRKKKSAEIRGVPLTSLEEEQLRIGKEVNKEYQAMKRAILQELIKLGKARPEVLKTMQKNRVRDNTRRRANKGRDRDRLRELKEAKKSGEGGLTEEEQQELDVLQAQHLKANRYRRKNIRIQELEGSKADQGLTQEEQQELDALRSWRARYNQNAIERRRKQKEKQRTQGTRQREDREGNEADPNPASQGVSDSNPSREDSPSSEHPPTDRLEMSTGHPPSSTMDSSRALTHSPAVNRQSNHWYAGLLPFIKNKLSGTRAKSFLDNVSRVITDRLHKSPGITPAPGIGPSAPIPPAPRVIF